ncbi:MAG: chemotaxis protein CheB [Limisphaerales bacterium]
MDARVYFPHCRHRSLRRGARSFGAFSEERTGGFGDGVCDRPSTLTRQAKDLCPNCFSASAVLRVIQVKDCTTVQPRLCLCDPTEQGHVHPAWRFAFACADRAPADCVLPIDFFFHSLAQDQQEHSVGVILSGMGSDGTLGLRAIKEKAGMVFVQETGNGQIRLHAAQRD